MVAYWVGPASALSLGRSSVHGKQLPQARHTLQFMVTSVNERDARSGDQVDHCPGHEHLGGACQGGDACTDMDCYASDIVPCTDDLAGMESRPYVDPETLKLVANRQPTLDRSCGSVEEGEEPIPRRVDLPPPEVLQLPTDGFVMHGKKFAPTLIANLGGRDRRANNVREEDSR